LIPAESRLDNPIGDDRADHDEQHARDDAEIEVRRQADRSGGINDVDGIIGHFREDAVNGLDKDIGAKCGGHPGKRRGQTDQRMPPQTMKGDAPSGINTKYPASEAMLDSTPRVTMMAVIDLRGATSTIFRIKAPMSRTVLPALRRSWHQDDPTGRN